MPRLRSSFARAVALLLCWQIGRLAPSFVPEVTQDNTLALGRRSALVGALSLTQPGMAWAKRGASEEGEMATKQAMPTEIETEEPINEEWKPVDIGESTLVDPDDPKYKNMRLMNEIEKQKQRNEEYNAMSPEEISLLFAALCSFRCTGAVVGIGSAVELCRNHKRRAGVVKPPQSVVKPPPPIDADSIRLVKNCAAHSCCVDDGPLLARRNSRRCVSCWVAVVRTFEACKTNPGCSTTR